MGLEPTVFGVTSRDIYPHTAAALAEELGLEPRVLSFRARSLTVWPFLNVHLELTISPVLYAVVWSRCLSPTTRDRHPT